MPNLTSILNDQIRRLAHREITSSTQVIRRATAQYRRDIASLKRQMAAMAKTLSFLEGQEKRRVTEQPVAMQESEGIRFRADGLRSHRAKLGMSAQDYGLLVGVTGQTIYDWEAGQSRPRKQQVAKVASVRGIGKREALKRLELLGAGKASSSPRRSRRANGQTAQEFILSMAKSGRGATTAEIDQAWRESGRAGRANNTLTIMTKAGLLKRSKIADGRGSLYVVSRG